MANSSGTNRLVLSEATKNGGFQKYATDIKDANNVAKKISAMKPATKSVMKK